VHISQPLGREEATKQRIGGHGRLDTRVMDQRLCGNFVQTGFGAAWLRRSSGTPLRENITKIHLAANQGESDEAASRKPKKPMRLRSIFAALGQAPSMKSINRLMSAGRSVSAANGSLWSRSGERPLSLG
jgi:hypothetical protein